MAAACTASARGGGDREYSLEPILRYGMTELEAKAYKVSIMWDTLSRREFPAYKFPRFVGRGDPRKSVLWRYCYKLVADTQGVLADDEYRLYVLAQLQVFGSIKDGRGVHPLIDPLCLVGEGAWVRWQMWKGKHDRAERAAGQKIRATAVAPSAETVAAALEATRDFLFRKFGGQPSKEQIASSVAGRDMLKWVARGRVSPYYVILSPWVAAAAGDLGKAFGMDFGVYGVPEGVEFGKIFSYEE